MADEAIPKLCIRSWPKMYFLWPTAIISLFLSIAASTLGDWEGAWGRIFLVVFFLNLLVLTFEFPRATSLTLVLAVIVGIGALIGVNHMLGIVEPLQHFFSNLDLTASWQFYLAFFIMYVVLLIGMFGVTRFDYWELSPNEVIHHHGVLGDVERFSTAGLKLNKEIHDVFEYMLAGAGRIILVIPGQPRPVILDNVLGISRVEKASDKILDARVVRLAGGGAAGHDDGSDAAMREAENA